MRISVCLGVPCRKKQFNPPAGLFHRKLLLVPPFVTVRQNSALSSANRCLQLLQSPALHTTAPLDQIQHYLRTQQQ